LFTDEETFFITGVDGFFAQNIGISLIQNQPNPVKDYTEFIIEAREDLTGQKGFIVIKDMLGKEIERLAFVVSPGIMKVMFTNNSSLSGIYTYTLEMNGKAIQTKKIIFYH